MYTTSKELSGKSTKVASQMSKETCMENEPAGEEEIEITVTAFNSSHTSTHAHTDTRTHLCLFRSEDCSLQSNADHVHTEVDGMHHCTILFGLQGAWETRGE